MDEKNPNVIAPDEAKTLSEMFIERVKRMPNNVAYKHHDTATQTWIDTTWQEMAHEVGRWQAAFSKMGLQQGDRAAVMLPNSREWVLFDQAALGIGVISVPIYTDDRPENAAYIITNAGAKLVLVEGKEQWQALLSTQAGLPTVEHIVSIAKIEPEDMPLDKRLISFTDYLFGIDGEPQSVVSDPDSLATIVYTSGTTGNPKGVMLSHKNILSNTWGACNVVSFKGGEVFLSFLPLSHTLERTAGYYLPMMGGGTVAYARSTALLAEDLVEIRPTILLSVPKIYEKFYARIADALPKQSAIKRFLFKATCHVGWKRFEFLQGRKAWSPLLLFWPLLAKLVANKILARLGGRIEVAICGGAPLQAEIGRFFISMGLPLLQGYGLTESSPVISVNRLEHNKPQSIGKVLMNVRARIAEDGELQTDSDSVMLGYWKNPEATAEVFTEDGWLKTGDIASIDEDEHFYITGRIKEIIVLSNGEKIPPADMELAIALDPLFDAAIVIGESKSYLVAIVVINKDIWQSIAVDFGVDANDKMAFNRGDVNERMLNRVTKTLAHFPGYAQIRRAHFTFDEWNVDNGLLTPTLKVRRSKIQERYLNEIEGLYKK